MSVPAAVETTPPREEWVHKGTVTMRDLVIGIAVSGGLVDADEMQSDAEMLTRWAKSILSCARARGDDHADAPGTFDDALAGSEFFLHFADELRMTAAKMRAGESQ